MKTIAERAHLRAVADHLMDAELSVVKAMNQLKEAIAEAESKQAWVGAVECLDNELASLHESYRFYRECAESP